MRAAAAAASLTSFPFGCCCHAHYVGGGGLVFLDAFYGETLEPDTMNSLRSMASRAAATLTKGGPAPPPDVGGTSNARNCDDLYPLPTPEGQFLNAWCVFYFRDQDTWVDVDHVSAALRKAMHGVDRRGQHQETR